MIFPRRRGFYVDSIQCLEVCAGWGFSSWASVFCNLNLNEKLSDVGVAVYTNTSTLANYKQVAATFSDTITGHSQLASKECCMQFRRTKTTETFFLLAIGAKTDHTQYCKRWAFPSASKMVTYHHLTRPALVNWSSSCKWRTATISLKYQRCTECECFNQGVGITRLYA